MLIISDTYQNTLNKTKIQLETRFSHLYVSNVKLSHHVRIFQFFEIWPFCPLWTQHFHMFTNNNNCDRNLWIGAPLLLEKVKFLIYKPILMKFETQHFHMFINNNGDRNVWIGAPLPPQGPFPHPSQKCQIFHFCAILIEFETQHFHMFTKNIWDRNLWMEAHLPPGGPSLHPPQKSKILHLWPDFDRNLW